MLSFCSERVFGDVWKLILTLPEPEQNWWQSVLRAAHGAAVRTVSALSPAEPGL